MADKTIAVGDCRSERSEESLLTRRLFGSVIPRYASE